MKSFLLAPLRALLIAIVLATAFCAYSLLVLIVVFTALHDWLADTK